VETRAYVNGASGDWTKKKNKLYRPDTYLCFGFGRIPYPIAQLEKIFNWKKFLTL
jgi:hypothetical protein